MIKDKISKMKKVNAKNIIRISKNMNFDDWTVAEIKAELKARNAAGTSGKKKAELWQMLQQALGGQMLAKAPKTGPAPREFKKELAQLKVKELKEQLKRMQLPTSGTKAVLVRRLAYARAGKPEPKTPLKARATTRKTPARRTTGLPFAVAGAAAAAKAPTPRRALTPRAAGAAVAAGDYDKLTVAQIKDILRNRKLPLTGKKADLIARLRAGAAATPAAMPVTLARTGRTPPMPVTMVRTGATPRTSPRTGGLQLAALPVIRPRGTTPRV